MLVCKSCGNTFESSQDILEKADKLRVCAQKNLWFNCQCGSTHLIKSGNFDWFKPTMLMRDEVKQIYVKYNMIGKIPLIQSWVMRLQQVIEDEKSTYSKINKELEKSPNIAYLTLKIASNLVPGTPDLFDLEHAIGLLGRKALSNIVLSASISNLPLQTKRFNSKIFWQNSITVGNFSREIFNRFGYSSSGSSDSLAFFLGCFHNIGKLIAASMFPEKVDEVLKIIEDPNHSAKWEDAANFLGIPDKSLLGEIAVAKWGLPKELNDILAYFQGIKTLPEIDDKLHVYQCVEFASIANHWLKLNPHKIDEDKLALFQSTLKLDDTALEQIIFSLKNT